MKKIKIIFILLTVFVTVKVFSQKKFTVLYNKADAANNQMINLQSLFESNNKAKNYINNLAVLLQTKGYATASIDSVLYLKDSAIVHYFLGKQYNWALLDVTRIDKQALSKCNWDEQKINFNTVAALQQKLLDYYQENGYPFAAIKIDSININDKNEVTAQLIADKSFYHTIDSIRIIGNAKLNNTFLQKYLGIKNGSMYKKSVLDAIPQKLRQLPYIQEKFPYNITMLAATSVINLYLQPKKSSIVNILLGLIPAPNPNGLPNAPQGKLFLSGDANILLNNALTQGETIGLNYQQLSINSRRINLLYRQPFIFKSDYGIDFNFDIYKRDSSYLNLEANLGATYNLGTNKIGKAFFQYLRTNTFPDTSFVKLTQRLPDNLDVSVTNLGVQYEVSTTDYRRNPRAGLEWVSQFTFGAKKIKKNNGITSIKDGSFNYAALYDSISLKTYQLKLKTYFAKYIPVKKQMVLKAAVNGGLLLSQNYFRNELFQIGGFKLLRGFDEESQFCNRYLVATGEWRYLIGGDSYFFAFIDGGYTNSAVSQLKHTYFSTGLGLNFGTKAGLFNMSLALGSRNDIPLGFKQAKLHFGYVTIF